MDGLARDGTRPVAPRVAARRLGGYYKTISEPRRLKAREEDKLMKKKNTLNLGPTEAYSGNGCWGQIIFVFVNFTIIF